MRLDRCTAVVPQHETAIAVSIGGTLRVLRAALTLSARACRQTPCVAALGEPWWVTRDVCCHVGARNPRKLRLSNDRQSVRPVDQRFTSFPENSL
jgi:hypothetical protein